MIAEGPDKALVSELALVMPVQEGRKPLPGDQRELVPVIPRRAEELLEQMAEENRSLRLRLEQLETQSSWHSGGTRASQEMPEQSPVSFAPCGMTGVGRQSAQEVVQESLLRADTGRMRVLKELGSSTGPQGWPTHVGMAREMQFGHRGIPGIPPALQWRSGQPGMEQLDPK